jgi:hypothetical protein
MNYGCSIFYDVSALRDIKDIPVAYSNVAMQYREAIPVNAIFSPVSGSLLLGTFSGDLEALQHLKSVVDIDTHGSIGEIYDNVSVLKLANMYRLFGHNMSVRDSLSANITTPWGRAQECIIEPASIEFDPNTPHRWLLHDSNPRPGRNLPLPNIVVLADFDQVAYVIRKPNIRVCEWASRTREVIYTVSSRKKAVPVTFRVLAPLVSQKLRFQAKVPERPKPVPSFREAQATVTPHKPEVTVVQQSVGTAASFADMTSQLPDVVSAG